ncbi:hypothetical protein QTP70_031032 [Hemibagrus guttatus]|uniref:CASP8-associated protein 2 n=1 Tax=Hemibagrus guttatus TaxID=175788 RepID=A0AAE0PRX7_9TELE|nr:hypothetical protein QTP70_031032 [Hemibagrus guttatus]
METSAIDELYGNLGQEHHDSVLNYDEDSVDIYSGLEDSPKKTKDHGKKDSTFLSPIRVKESLDLYEELITQEQEEKDATYNELKSKFVAAQNQVQDLLAQLQHMQTKNSSLHHENTLLKKNICALIKTAKMEIVRKDEEIIKLSKRSSRGSFHPSAKERGHNAYCWSSANKNNLAGAVKESQELKRDEVLAEVSQGRSLFNNQPGDSSSMDSTPSSSVMMRKCTRSNIENPLNRQNKDSRGLDSLPNASPQDQRHVQGNRERESTSETSTTRRACDEKERSMGVKQSGKESTSKEKDVSERSQTKMDKNREQRATAESSCAPSSGQQQDDPVTFRRSGRSGSSSSHASSSESRSNTDTQSRKEESWHKQGQERQSANTEVSGVRSEKSSSDKSHGKTEKRGMREHQRKEERRQEGMSSSERKRTRSDSVKEYEHRKTDERNRADEKNSSRGERRSTRPETTKEPEGQSAKDLGTTRGMGNHADKMRISDGKDRSRADVRENRRHGSPVKPHHSAQNLRKDQDDRRRTSSKSKASSSRDTRGDTSDRHGVSKGRSDKEKRSSTSDKGSKNALDNASVPKTREDGNVQADVLASTRRKSPVRLASSCDSSGVTEESSPKRKLTFMETLNLTLSPIKKQNNSEGPEPQEPVQPPPEDTLASNSTKDRSLFEVGEDFCVIDEVEDDCGDDSLAHPTNATTEPHDTEPPASLEVTGKELELPKRFDGDLNETQSGKVDGTDSEMQEEESLTKADDSEVCPTGCISQKSVLDKTAVPKVSLLPEQAQPVDNPTVPITDVSCKEDSQVSVKKNKERIRIGAKNSGEQDQIDDKSAESRVQNDSSQQEVATSVIPTPMTQTCSNTDMSLEVVSSTVGVENNQQCKETIAVSDMEITQVLENPAPCPDLLMGPSTELVNVNSTAQKDGILPEQVSSSEPDSKENQMAIPKPSRSVVVAHDEDSMMLTLSNIKVIPEAISPLTSPVRQIKKSQQQRLGKESHVKSLSKEYVDSVNFDKFCTKGNEVKPLLNKIIQSVMKKVSNNGIVNRIFEQRAEDLKQKLWNFVDGQFDFLFKELKAALKSATDLFKNKTSLESKPSNPSVKENSNVDVCKLQSKEPLSTTENRPHKKSKDEIESEVQKVQEKTTTSYNLPCRGLGSSGKNIKATMEEVPEVPTPNQSNQLQVVSFSDKSLQENVPAPENKTSSYVRRLSHSGSTQDRADFEILTEQQTSSLTFNLVTDSQMGEIFRCLLQGDLDTVDNPNWPLNTPRKEGQAGENLLGMTPSKMITPSKLITAWTSFSPYKFQMPLNPAVLDENCMLEVPSNAVPNQSVPAVAAASSQQSYSILAEDLAVSLTIPSPLKSDGHLSFLNQASGQPLSTPSNVISAHYSEDALLDGEDVTEQDIHLSLETDNSSSPSSTSGNWDVFQFKPNLPMQAEVMERSNDHFIVRIRQTSLGVQEEPLQKQKGTPPSAEVLPSSTLNCSQPLAERPQVTSNEGGEIEISRKNASNGVLAGGNPATLLETTENQIKEADVDTNPTGVATAQESEHVVKNSCQRVSRKRKKHHSGPKTKRSRRDKSQDKQEKQRHKKRSKSSKEKNEKTPSKKIKAPSPQLSPNSLSAKNVIRKKGEVVVTWTREEDRDILVALKTKGASSKTFAALSSKLRKSQAQIEERFTQLMKLFKKKEKMEG